MFIIDCPIRCNEPTMCREIENAEYKNGICQCIENQKPIIPKIFLQNYTLDHVGTKTHNQCPNIT